MVSRTLSSRLSCVVSIVFLSCLWLVSSIAWAKPVEPNSKQTNKKVGQAMSHQTNTPTGKVPSSDVDTISGMHGLLNLTVSYNLLGARVIGALGYRKRLYKSKSKLLSQNFIGAHVITRLTPAWLEGGAVVAFQPLTILKLRGAYRFRTQVPTFFSGGAFKSMDAVRAAFKDVVSHRDGEDVLRTQIDNGSKTNGGNRILPQSHIVSIDATLRFRLKGIVLLANARYSKWWSSMPQSDTHKVFYEGGHDMIFSLEEDFLMVGGVLGYEWKNFRFLAYANYRTAFNAGTVNFRVGPAFQWIIAKNWSWFKKPAIFAVLNWYLQHDWRGRDGIPLVGVRFGGEF